MNTRKGPTWTCGRQKFQNLKMMMNSNEELKDNEDRKCNKENDDYYERSSMEIENNWKIKNLQMIIIEKVKHMLS